MIEMSARLLVSCHDLSWTRCRGVEAHWRWGKAIPRAKKKRVATRTRVTKVTGLMRTLVLPLLILFLRQKSLTHHGAERMPGTPLLVSREAWHENQARSDVQARSHLPVAITGTQRVLMAASACKVVRNKAQAATVSSRISCAVRTALSTRQKQAGDRSGDVGDASHVIARSTVAVQASES